jgi:hypothetical protein
MVVPVSSQMSTRKAKCVLVFMGKPDSTRPGPLVFIRECYYAALLHPNGFIEPCLPSPAPKPPAGAGWWIHEIKLEGFRLLARRDAAGVRLLIRRCGIQWPCHLVEVSRA